MEFKKYLDEAFAINLAKGATIEATNTRGKSYRAKKATDGDPETYWAAEDRVTEATVELDFGKQIEVNAVLIQEFIPLGQRVRSFSVDAHIYGTFDRVAKGVTIGNRRIVTFEPVTTQRLKINFEAKACPLIANIEVYRIPDI
jgi:alpha-L-fucosidase